MVRHRENAKQAGDVTSWSILTIPEQSSFFIAYKKYEIFEHQYCKESETAVQI